MSFKVGDRVKVTRDAANMAKVKEGDIGTVTKVEGKQVGVYWYRVRMDYSRTSLSGAAEWSFADPNLEPVARFSIGDRIRVLYNDAKFAQVKSGDEGRVVEVKNDIEEIYVVMADYRPVGTRPKDYDWYFGFDDVEKIEPDDIPLPDDEKGFSEVEIGEFHDITVSTLAKIAKDTGVSVSLTVYPFDSDPQA